MENEKVYKKAISLETFVFLGLVGIFFGYASSVMGVDKMFNTLMNTAHYLLIDVVFFIMAIAVLAGAFGALLSEFGVIALINRMISPIMGPIYGLPGAASLGMLTTYLSDNPAILALAHDRGFKQFFTDEQLPTLCNLGTAFGMGLILTTYMIGLGNGVEFIVPVLIGNLGAVIGSVVSVRMMRHYTRRYFASDLEATASKSDLKAYFEYREIRSGSIFERILDAVLEGGKAGVATRSGHHTRCGCYLHHYYAFNFWPLRSNRSLHWCKKGRRCLGAHHRKFFKSNRSTSLWI